MLISELIERLTELKNQHGDLKVIDIYEDEVTFVEPKKFIKTKSPYNHIITTHVESMDDNYLEEIYEQDEEYKKCFVSKGLCIKIS